MLLALSWRKLPRAKEGREALEAENGNKKTSHYSLQKWKHFCQNLDFSSVRPVWNVWPTELQNDKFVLF